MELVTIALVVVFGVLSLVVLPVFLDFSTSMFVSVLLLLQVCVMFSLEAGERRREADTVEARALVRGAGGDTPCR